MKHQEGRIGAPTGQTGIKWQNLRCLLLVGVLSLSGAAAQADDLYFASSKKLDDGAAADIALNGLNQVVEIHQGASHITSNLYYRAGTLADGVISWGDVTYFDKGTRPAVTLNRSGVVLEIHETSGMGTSLWYHVGTLTGQRIAWGESISHDSGKNPSIAANDSGLVVEVHEMGSEELAYNVGTVDANAKTVAWQSSSGSKIPNVSGTSPSVSLTNDNTVVLSYTSKPWLYYLVGRVDSRTKAISWESQSHNYANGVNSSLDLTDAGFVVDMHESEFYNRLWTSTGLYDAGTKTISFGPFWEFDYGLRPAVAVNDLWGVQIHESESSNTLWPSTARRMDSSNWMGQNLPVLRDRPLKQLAFPGSHDAAMYAGGLVGKTQEFNLQVQLRRGARWFDLRPKQKTDGSLIFHHSFIDGPEVSEVLADVATFMNEGHRELVFLKFSHFDSMDDNASAKLVKMIQSKLGTWLYTSSFQGRLAEQRLDTLIGSGGKVIPLFDGDYILHHKTPGFFVYRDCTSSDPENADLTVYDEYSNTRDLGTMEKDQLGKWAAFKGACKNSSTPCDMFLLSWTLTPPTDVWSWAKDANAVLSEQLNGIQLHDGLVPNILYTDYVDYANAAYTANRLNSRRRISMLPNSRFLVTKGGQLTLGHLDGSPFSIENLPGGGKFALKDRASNKYFCVGSNNNLFAVGDLPASTCRFEIVPTGPNSFAVKGPNGLYLRRYSNGSLAVNDQRIGRWNQCYLH